MRHVASPLRAWLTLTMLLAVSASLTGCQAPREPALDDERVRRLELQADLLETALEETRAAALRPAGGAPPQRQEGRPIPVDDALLEEFARDGRQVADCPVVKRAFAVVQTEVGTDCATYAAEIASFFRWCTEACDEQACCARTVRQAAAKCAEWCSSKDCGARVSFVPPARCASYGCFDFLDGSAEGCTADCPKSEWTSLLSIKRGLNCFCTDVIED